jgi:putative acetyltransferase
MITIIRPEREADHIQVSTLLKEAFGQENEARLVAQLRTGAGYIPALSLVAILNEKVAGHIMLNRIAIVNGDARYDALALAPMAVHPSWQKQGIGARLITEALRRAREMGFTAVIVLGHEHYYPKFGFLPASRFGIRAPIDVPDNVFMAKELIPGSLAHVSGVVEYPVEFSTI